MSKCRICGKEPLTEAEVEINHLHCQKCNETYGCHRCGDIAERDLADGLCPDCQDVETELGSGAFCHSCPWFELDAEVVPHHGDGHCHLFPKTEEKSDGDWCAQHPPEAEDKEDMMRTNSYGIPALMPKCKPPASVSEENNKTKYIITVYQKNDLPLTVIKSSYLPYVQDEDWVCFPHDNGKVIYLPFHDILKVEVFPIPEKVG